MLEWVTGSGMAVAWVGLAAGVVHALSGPDHLAALAPLTVDDRQHSWLKGGLWGVGHALGVWGVGLVLVLARGLLPLAWLGAWGDRLVGVVLIGVGLWGLRKAFTSRVHAHTHAHQGRHHLHLHAHLDSTHHQTHPPREHQRGEYHSHAALGIGLLHGVAGSAYVIGILPTLLAPSLAGAVAYLVAFGVGNVVGMAAFAGALGLLAGGLSRAGINLHRWLLAPSSLFALAVGCVWVAG